ncbi:MAG: YncE family protein, partial [Muribaculaceae bacterium]|nr:YncE family protein [Muribaculaceae bacterium]
MRNNTLFFHITVMLIALLLVSCRQDESILLPEVVPTTQPEVAPTTQPEYTNITGFYLLNEGNMGSNKATLDYMDYGEGKYHRNIFAKANPSQVKEMGDVGNDLGIYGNKLWCVINCSNKIDVLDK